VALRRFGPLVAYRIADSRFPLLDGAGASQVAGRWHRPGRLIIYAGLGFAVAMLEKLVRLRTGSMPSRQQFAEILIHGAVEIEQIGPADVPGWERSDRAASQAYGDAWYDSGRTAVLIVPSVPAMGLEHNVLINQRHPAFARITTGPPRPVLWDARLFASN
jgi:RES domain-containing protein